MLLERKTPNNHLCAPLRCFSYMSGGAGYVLSREAVRRLVRHGYHQGAAARCRRWGGAEDAALGKCLEAVGVRPGVSLDAQSRQTFHPFNVLTHLSGTYPRWYYEYSKYHVKQVREWFPRLSIDNIPKV